MKEISKKLVDIINEEDFKKALNDYNFEKCYRKINSTTDILAPKFTILLFNTGINPLEYMNKVPKYFLYNTDIETFKIPNNIISIGDNAFANCTSLTSVTIPNSVTSIGESAFSSCTSLSSVTIGSGVEEIGAWAFGSVNTSLSIINYTGTKSQWLDIELGYNWNYNVPATVVHCIDGDINL